jgi:hypothetical protein
MQFPVERSSFFNREAVGHEGGETRPIPASPRLEHDLYGHRSEADWLAKGKPAWNHRFEGNSAMAFDALVVIDTISPLRPLK